MKLDLFKKQWLEMVFEGKNKSYGAYDLRKKSPKMTAMALLVGTVFFAFAIAAPQIIGSIFDGMKNDEEADVRKVKMEKIPKKDKPKEIIEKPKPPPPKVDQVKFVKPVVAKADEVVEEIKQITPETKKTGAEDLKGDPDAVPTITPPSDGDVVEAVDNGLYDTAGIEVKPEFPGGIDKFYKYVGNNYQTPEEEGLKGKVYVSFVVEKDGSLTDIKAVRDIGYGTGAEAVRVLKKCPRWTPGVQNGKPVRCTYTLPISIQSAE
jgi:periplasmic protein TonB